MTFTKKEGYRYKQLMPYFNIGLSTMQSGNYCYLMFFGAQLKDGLLLIGNTHELKTMGKRKLYKEEGVIRSYVPPRNSILCRYD